MKTLEGIIGFEAAKEINESIKAAPFRRLSDDHEVAINADILCQSFHLNSLTGPSKLILGDESGGYHMHSVESVMPKIDNMRKLGINKIYLGTDSVIGGGGSYLHKLESFSEILQSLRNKVGKDLEILIDPAGLCLRKDLRWGVTAEDGTISAVNTLSLLAQAAISFADAGANSLLTIGRTNCEVATVKKALEKANKELSILSFSTNSETTSAYFETTQHDILRSRTGQKILVGNIEEMIIRAVIDFGEGSDVIVQKPIEAFQLPAILNLISTGVIDIDLLIAKSQKMQELLDNNPLACPAFETGRKLIKTGERSLKVGTYEVSGTYSNVQLLSQKFSEQLGWSMLDEIFLNAASAAGKSLGIMISRNASWYLEKRAQYVSHSKAA
jgi:delta-aminolevulinic acid dehydratase/porphobilinogen synthase